MNQPTRYNRAQFLKQLGYGLFAGWGLQQPKTATPNAASKPTSHPTWTLSRKVPILLVTGIDYPGHHWRETTPVLVQAIEEDPRLDVRVVMDPFFLECERIEAYRAILLHFMNWKQPGPGPKAQHRLQNLVSSGGGLVLVHFACGAWQEWPGFVHLAGRVWDPNLRGHDPRGRFRVHIADPHHPITKGMSDFETDDELYTCLSGQEPIHVLATARSRVDGKTYPIAFVHRYGAGRVFHCVLGHDVKALRFAPVQKLFRRGTAWAAGVLKE